MNILVLNLPRYEGIPVTREYRCEPILKNHILTPTTSLTLAAILRNQGHKVSFIDANAYDLSFYDISERIKNKKIDCIIFSFNSQIIDYDMKICHIAKENNHSCITIGYSWYAKGFAEGILGEYPDLDILIVGEPLSTICNLGKCLNGDRKLETLGGIAFRNGNELKVDRNNMEMPLDEAPFPAYDLLPSFRPYHVISQFFSPFAMVISGRGCPFGCRFCNVSRTKYNCKLPANVVNELKTLQRIGGVRYVWFFDEVFTLRRRRVIEICTRIIREGIKIKWFCDTRVDLVDEDLLKLMHKAGCIGIAYGVESGSQRILTDMNKGISIEQIKKASIWTRKAHIPFQMNLILGYRQETPETIRETKLLVNTILPENLQIGIAAPKPGTEFAKTEFESVQNSEDYDWKVELTGRPNSSCSDTSYIAAEIKNIKKTLILNPKWWLNSANMLSWNSCLVFPIIDRYLLRR